MPDATGLELTAQELREAHSDSVLDTSSTAAAPTLIANPAKIKAVLQHLQGRATPSSRACTASTTTPTSRAWA